MLPSLATLEEFSDRIPGDIDPADEDRARGLLYDASTMIRAETGKTWEDETPPAVAVMICIQSAKRAFLNPDAVRASADGVDGFTHSEEFAVASPDVYLTSDEKRLLHATLGAKTGLWALELSRGDLETPAVAPIGSTAWLDTEALP